MSRPDLSRVAKFYHGYIAQAKQDNVVTALHELGNEFAGFLASIPAAKHDHAYAKDKWTIKEVVQHIIDAERIFLYRALCFARQEEQSLPGFEENDYAANSKAADRDWNDLIEEFIVVRKSSELLFKSFDKEQLESGGLANNNPLYVLALGYIIAGHCQHHLNVTKERYL